jgi:hypothetical protein
MRLHNPYYTPFVCKNEKILPKVKVRRKKKERRGVGEGEGQ